MPKKTIKSPKINISHLHNSTEIVFWLNEYEDLFSDFDPRPYFQKALSDDFLSEAKKASSDKINVENLKLLMPKKLRSIEEEKIIKGRLKEHFNKHYLVLKNEKRKIIQEGALFIIFGVISNLIKTTISIKSPNLISTQFFISLIDPISWFLFWEGLNRIIFSSRDNKNVLEFYKKMSQSEVIFVSY